MGILKMMHFAEGSLTIRAEGVFLERFLNICTRRELDIRNVRRLGEEVLTAEISIRSFRRIRPICVRTQTRVRIQRRKGLPFLLHRYRKRRIALAGLLLALLLLWYTSGHIMGITVFGNERISTEEVMRHLERSGVALGRSARNLDSSVIRNQMMRDLDDLAWVGINVSGSRVYVEVVERLEKAEVIDAGSPCHLVAEKDGVIDAIEAREGQTMVKIGSGVRAGDVLVSGIVDNPVKGYRAVHAYGAVFAKTRYTATREYPLSYEEKVDTGQEKKRYMLRVLEREIPLYLQKKQPYETASVTDSEREYRLPFDLFPSLFVRTTVYREQRAEARTRTEKEAIALGKEELSEELLAGLSEGVAVEQEELSHTLTERGTVSVSLTLHCRENIAAKKPIEVETLEALQ